jgi:hypothetical protein
MNDRQLADLSAAAYTARPTWVHEDVHACLTEVGGVLVVAFRGTVPDSLEDWLRDFSVIPAWGGPLGEVHDGFFKGASALQEPITEAIGARPYVLIGHSLGGALAIITAGLLTCYAHAPLALVTYGAPRCGGQTLVDALEPVKRICQYRAGSDPVPNVPFGYKHIRPLTHVGATPPAWSLPSIADHGIANYQKLVPDSSW